MAVSVFRFAPSPNGLLHLGHAFSALLNDEMARAVGGRLLLRMEDTDVTRCRPHFVDAIFTDLSWLGLRWEEPVRFQSAHFDEYDRNLARLRALGAIYPCFCSRREAGLAALATSDPYGQRHYGGTCRAIARAEADQRIATGQGHGWRLDMELCGDSDAAVWGDVVIARRHVGSYYHIAVVTDDAIQGVTHVVRGMDIAPATPIHLLLQRLLGLPSPHYHHHRLILDDDGKKLSKSHGSVALAALRQAGETPASIRARLGIASLTG